jgi:NAD(P)-dependent dehydrogenase (short-subunit alcohol dehydrogenase family)
MDFAENESGGLDILVNNAGNHKLKLVEPFIWLAVIAYSILMSVLGVKGLLLDLQKFVI